MTCIVGLVEDKVYIGGDSLASCGCVRQTMNATKVFRNQDCIIGYSGTTRMANILQWGFVPPEHPAEMSVDQYLATLFIDAIRAKLKETGVAAKTNEQETNTGSMLVGYRGRLFKIGYDYGLMEATAGFDAVAAAMKLRSVPCMPQKRCLCNRSNVSAWHSMLLRISAMVCAAHS